MPFEYTNDVDQRDPWKLPNIEIFEATAREIAESNDDLIWEYSRKPAFRLASMNSTIRERMIDAIIEDHGIAGGFVWQYCVPGCLPDSGWTGPFKTYQEALQDAIQSTEVE